MGLFGTSSPFDPDVEKITNEKNTSEDWGLIMNLCDRVTTIKEGPRDCMRSIVRRLNHQDPHVVMQAIVLLDACVNNCGKPFRLEVASREFEHDFKKLLVKSHPRIQEKMKTMLKKWAEGEFKGDPQYSLIPSLYQNLKREGVDFNSSEQPKKSIPKDPNVVSSQQEEDDIVKAIQASLQESGSGGKQKQNKNKTTAASPSLYPSASIMGAGAGGAAGAATGGAVVAAPAGTFKEPKKARALYDFEAAEDNELTFQTGEIVLITDDSDDNWWKGSNHRGEGLFPANFVSTDMKAESEEPQRRRSVQFNEQVEIKTLKDDEAEVAAAAAALGPVEISEEKIDRVLYLLNDSDPTTTDNDDPELNVLEDHVNRINPLIDNELERVDRRLAQLTRLSTELVDAMNLYHQLMRELPAQPYQMPPAPNAGGGQYSMVPPPQQQQPYISPPYAAPGQQQMYAPPQAMPLPAASTAGYQMPSAAPAATASPGASLQQQPQPQMNGGQPGPEQYAWANGSPAAAAAAPPQHGMGQMPPQSYPMVNGGHTQQTMSQNGYSPQQASFPQQQHPQAPPPPLNA